MFTAEDTMRLLASSLFLSVACDAGTRSVALDGSGDYTAIQPAIDATADGDTVLVMPGEYVITEPIDFNRVHDSGNPASPAVKNIVLRSEAGAGETTIRMAEEPADLDRASVVLFQSGESELSRLEGFKLSGGKGTLRERPWRGGGVYCYHSSPTLINCTIAGNAGEGVYCGSHSSLTLTCCVVWRDFVDSSCCRM